MGCFDMVSGEKVVQRNVESVEFVGEMILQPLNALQCFLVIFSQLGTECVDAFGNPFRTDGIIARG